MDRRDFVLSTLLGLVSRPLSFLFDRHRAPVQPLPLPPTPDHQFVKKVKEMLEKRRRDPQGWNILPYPLPPQE